MRILAILAAVASAAAAYKNPVLPMDFPDPTVVKGLDGNYYAYATMGNGHRLQVAASADLVRDAVQRTTVRLLPEYFSGELVVPWRSAASGTVLVGGAQHMGA
jgi:hypothetical protein